jgi:ferrous iron transport protein B
MATRTIEDPKHRLTTILIAPLMTCSARLPVYAVIIGAFIPATEVGSGIGLQGLVLFALYVAGIGGALVAALVLRRTVARGQPQSFMMEMPKYQLPSIRDVAIGCGSGPHLPAPRRHHHPHSTMVLWACSPSLRPGRARASWTCRSPAGWRMGWRVVEPIGFNKEIALALVPAMAAREVAVAALATAYSIDAPMRPPPNRR